MVPVLWIGAPQAQAIPPVACAWKLTADVVALDQAVQFNRYDSQYQASRIYALRHDVVPEFETGALMPGNVRLRDDHRPRPVVLQMNVDGCLAIRFQNLPSPTPVSVSGSSGISFDHPADRGTGIHVAGLSYNGSMQDGGAFVGPNVSSLAAPGGSATYRLLHFRHVRRRHGCQPMRVVKACRIACRVGLDSCPVRRHTFAAPDSRQRVELRPRRRHAAQGCKGLCALTGNLLLLAAQPAAALEPGKALYASGASAPRALTAGGAALAATALPWAGCHGEPGTGGRAEAWVRSPAVTWAVLAHPTPKRPAYDKAMLLRSVAQVLAPGERVLDGRQVPESAEDCLQLGLLLPPDPRGNVFAAAFGRLEAVALAEAGAAQVLVLSAWAGAEGGPLAYAPLPGEVEEGVALLRVLPEPGQVVFLAADAAEAQLAGRIAERVAAFSDLELMVARPAALPEAALVVLALAASLAQAVASLRDRPVPMSLPGSLSDLAAPTAAALERLVLVGFGVQPETGEWVVLARFRVGEAAHAGLAEWLGHAGPACETGLPLPRQRAGSPRGGEEGVQSSQVDQADRMWRGPALAGTGQGTHL